MILCMRHSGSAARRLAAKASMPRARHFSPPERATDHWQKVNCCSMRTARNWMAVLLCAALLGSLLTPRTVASVLPGASQKSEAESWISADHVDYCPGQLRSNDQRDDGDGIAPFQCRVAHLFLRIDSSQRLAAGSAELEAALAVMGAGVLSGRSPAASVPPPRGSA